MRRRFQKRLKSSTKTDWVYNNGSFWLSKYDLLYTKDRSRPTVKVYGKLIAIIKPKKNGCNISSALEIN